MKILIVIVLALTLPCTAAFLEVPDDFATIGEALQASSQSDTILVHPGLYPERLILPGHDFLLVSEFYFTHDSSALYNTVIDASDFAEEDTASVLTFVHGNSRATLVSGFTLCGGHGFTSESGSNAGGGIYTKESHPTILSNLITDNQATSAVAVRMNYSHARLAHNLICENCGDGEVIAITWYSDLDEAAIVEWNDITGNYGCSDPDRPHLGGSAIYVYQCGAAIRFNRIHDHTGNFYMGANFHSAWGELLGNSFERLTYEHFPGSQDMAGVVFLYHSRVRVRDNLFRDCILDWGPALDIVNRPLAVPNIIERNWFENIRSVSMGLAALYVCEPSGTIRENVFCQCVGDGLAAIGLSSSAAGTQGCRAIIEGNHFFYNRSLWEGPEVVGSALGFSGHGASLCTVRQNWFEGNQGVAITHEHLPDPRDWDCRWNYWGDPSGPYHPTLNPEGRGDTVDTNIIFDPWLTEPRTTSAGPSSPFALAPEDWRLEPPFPNPFNATTHIRLVSSRPQPFEVTVYNLLGRRVCQLWRGVVPKDVPVSVSWDGRDERGQVAATGLYFIVATPKRSGSSHPKARKVLFLR